MKIAPTSALLLLLLGACGDDPKPGGGSVGAGDTGAEDTGGDELVDADGDGFDSTVDCDDADPAVNPSATEVCGGGDDDCDGLIDDEDDSVALAGTVEFWPDVDGDGFGDASAEAVSACARPADFAEVATASDDANRAIHPEATEICGGVDEDCDGLIDDADDSLDAETATAWSPDLDGDGHGAADAEVLILCEAPADHVDDASDCDDGDAAISPEAVEICSGVDENCDGLIDDEDSTVDLGTATLRYQDVDEDGFGDAGAPTVLTCDLPAYHADLAGDCDDLNAAINPSATEVCGGVDEDCDGLIDDEDSSLDSSTALSLWPDADADGFGDAAAEAVLRCVAGAAEVTNADDCEDTLTDVNPSAAEVCDDDLDNDCDGTSNDCEVAGTIAFADADLRITSDQPGDLLGFSAATSDLNGDGVADLVIGASDRDSTASAVGLSAVVFGPLSADLVLSGAAAITFEGSAANDNAGTALAADGDLDGDGLADLVISAPQADAGGSNAGAAYVIYGPLDALSGANNVAAVAGLTYTGGAAGDGLGRDVNYVGDLNGDGFDDLAMGADGEDDGGAAAGAVYLIFGGPGRLSGLRSADGFAGTKIIGGAAADALGDNRNIASQLDLDADGLDDLLIAAAYADPNGSNSGAAYVQYGQSGGWAAAIGVGALDARIDGGAAADYLGDCVASVGDVNADGYDDMMLGARGAGAGNTGEAYLIYGAATPLSAQQAVGSAAAATFTGGGAGDGLGTAIEGGDVNDDGYADLILGAGDNDAAGSNAGAVTLFYGGALSGGYAAADAQATLRGEAASDYFGGAVLSDDLNGDGIDDLLGFGSRGSKGAVLWGGHL